MTFPGARFLLFDPVGTAWPAVRLPQVAFAGRSKVSNTPGRTRGIALFDVMGRFALADLPGYGFAKVSMSEREAWKELVEGYLSGCRRLRRVYILVDLRRGPGEEERRLAEYLAAHSVPYRWVGTKADKLSAGELSEALRRFAGEPWLDGGGAVIWTSARTKAGIDRVRSDIRAVFPS
jgi:GTP-binding protein